MSLLFELHAAPGLARSLCERTGCVAGRLEVRHFPDGETYLRIASDVTGKQVVLLCTLDDPDSRLAPLVFAAAAARAQGACSVGLVAPYLAYLRQDAVFRPGEAVTSAAFADLLSRHFDWLVTVDPHLHRYHSLSEIYSIRALAASAAAVIGEWARREFARPVIVGPDEESRQWVQSVAEAASADFIVLGKRRSGDTEVEIDGSGLAGLPEGTPVIVDDIASSGRTLVETAKLLRRDGRRPACAIVHPIFAGDSYRLLAATGARPIVSTNSIAHSSNAVDIAAPLAAAMARVMDTR